MGGGAAKPRHRAMGDFAVARAALCGSYEIHWWLVTSVNRTTIFAQVAIYTDLAIWMVIAFGVGTARAARQWPEPSPVTARTHRACPVPAGPAARRRPAGP